MAFTYTPADLADSELFQVRFEIGDTDSANPLLDDDEILYALSVERNMWGAAARCAETLARKFVQKADVSLGRNLKIEYSKRSSGYLDLAKGLRAKNLGTVLPYVGGRSLAAKADARADPAAVQPLFTKRMEENPRTGGLSSTPNDQPDF